MSVLTPLLALLILVLLYVVLRRYRQRDAARQDAITGLPGRETFDWYLDNCVARASRREGYAFGVLLLDVRAFVAARRSGGRATPATIVNDVAERVRWVIRPSDVLAEFSEESFGIILDDVRRITDVTRVAMRIHRALRDAPGLAGASGTRADVRLGVTMSRVDNPVEPRELIKEAEVSLQRAVSAGRPYVVFDQLMDEVSQTELSLENELSRAVERAQLSLSFQPLVTSDTRQLIGFTAFVQWMHPTRGLLRANEFIALAEASRYVVKIGEWVVGAAVKTLQQLSDAAGRPLILTFNVGATEVERGDLAGTFATALAANPALGAQLRVELPYALFAHPTPAFTSLATRLRDLGVGLHIDHAATGSVSGWRSAGLGVRGVRINLAEIDSSDAPMLSYLLQVSREIAEEVVVEGIESFEDDRVVRQLVPPVMAQGYQIARPMTLEKAIELARSGSSVAVLPRS